MKVVILCGGKGTRIREHSESIPKGLVEVGGKPILWHIMKHYAFYGFKEFVLCLGYKKEKIEDYFRSLGSAPGKVQFVDSGVDSSKSERILAAQHLIDTEEFLVAYGDDVADVPIDKVIALHRAKGKTATLTAIPLHSEFGVLEINPDSQVSKFTEKPRLPGYWFNGGFFVFQRRLFDLLHLGELEKEVFERLAAENEVVAYQHEGFWKCMNTYKDYQELNDLWDRGQADWKVWSD